jgi:hypothetical protein
VSPLRALLVIETISLLIAQGCRMLSHFIPVVIPHVMADSRWFNKAGKRS